MAFDFQKRTAEEKKQKQANKSSSYLAKKTAVDASDIKIAYREREEDMKDHQRAYENNNWKMAFGFLSAGLGTGGAITGFADLDGEEAESAQQTTSVAPADEGSSYSHTTGFTIAIDATGMGFSLVLAFAGAALIASGIKGKQAIKNLIRDKVDHPADQHGKTGEPGDMAGWPPPPVRRGCRP